jgi:uncharacterized protein (DUF952 family)
MAFHTLVWVSLFRGSGPAAEQSEFMPKDRNYGLFRLVVHRSSGPSLLGLKEAASVAPESMAEPIYKVMTEAAFESSWSQGQFGGSTDDLRDGFIHFSAAHQLAGTLAAHFAGQEELVLLAVDPERLGAHLKWEPSRGGALFPHLYAPLDLAAVLWAEPLTVAEDGGHVLPDRVVA